MVCHRRPDRGAIRGAVHDERGMDHGVGARGANMGVAMSMVLRLATQVDSEFLLALRNEPTVRAMSTNTAAISEAEHAKFMARWLNPLEWPAALYVAELDGITIGTGRIERAWTAISPKMDGCLIGYSLIAELRGQGYGKMLVSLLVEHAAQMGFATVGARIKRDNWSSIRCAVVGGVQRLELF